MNITKPAAVSAVAVAAMLAASAWAWPHAPAQLPVHWSTEGPDRWGPSAEALLLQPALAAVLALLFAALPVAMPRNARLERSARAYATAWIAVVLVLSLAHAVVVTAATGRAVEPARVIGGGVGLLIVVLGDLMGKMRRNYVMGVRTPWTLADERVWDRTHRAAGPWFMAWGVAVVAATLTSGEAVKAVTLGGAVAVTVGTVAYSYWTARRLGVA